VVRHGDDITGMQGAGNTNAAYLPREKSSVLIPIHLAENGVNKSVSGDWGTTNTVLCSFTRVTPRSCAPNQLFFWIFSQLDVFVVRCSIIVSHVSLRPPMHQVREYENPS